MSTEDPWGHWRLGPPGGAEFLAWPRPVPRILLRLVGSYSAALVAVILISMALPGEIVGVPQHVATALMLTPMIEFARMLANTPTTLPKDGEDSDIW